MKDQNQAWYVGHSCNPSPWEVEAGRSGVQGQPQLRETVLKEQTQEQNPDSNLLPVKSLAIVRPGISEPVLLQMAVVAIVSGTVVYSKKREGCSHLLPSYSVLGQ